MRPQRGLAFAGLALALGFPLTAVVASAGAAGSAGPPAGTPDPRLMVLKPADLGTKVRGQRYFRDTDFPSVISYERYFGEGRTGGSRLLFLVSSAEIGTSATTTATFVSSARRVFASKQGRAVLKRSFAQGVGDADVLISELQVGRPRNLGVGAGSFDLPMTVKILGLRTDIHVAFFRVDRVLGELLVIGIPGGRVPVSAMTRLARVMAGRMGAQLGPRNVVPPVVSGTAQVGRTLTSSPGAWTNDPSGFAYQWQRCDSAGASCTDIPGATGSDHVLDGADAGFTIRASVSARNGFGSGTARSAPTGVVLPSQAPTNVSPPTITGTAQAGQSLTASTGSWNGSPTGFGFQWQRCDSAGASCVDVPGATSGAYLLGSGDVGSTIRVAVTATSSFGATRAISAATAVVT